MTEKPQRHQSGQPPSKMRVGDACTHHLVPPPSATEPARAGIHLASVYVCQDAGQADALLGNELPGFAYQRDGHPNEWVVAERCRQLHSASFASIAPNGMGALALALLSVLQTGDHVLVSDQLYGKTYQLFEAEAARFGIESTRFSAMDPEQLAQHCRDRTKLVVIETISNPLMRVADIGRVAEIAGRVGARLLVDNTFASPALCRPLNLGADLVMESMTKVMNGHSDVLLGLLCGRDEALRSRMEQAQRTWGLVGSPFDCWLADRGLSTLHLRMRAASESACHVAQLLAESPVVEAVHYPGLTDSPDFLIASRQFGPSIADSRDPAFAERGASGDAPIAVTSQPLAGEEGEAGPMPFGNMLSFRLPGRRQVDQFVAQSGLPFCPSLGDVETTVSHPASTSHRGLNRELREKLGISEGLLRISVGSEPVSTLAERIERGLIGLDA